MGPSSLPVLVEQMPHIGTLEEYGPANAPENPIFRAIGKRFPTHPSDILQHLDELSAR